MYSAALCRGLIEARGDDSGEHSLAVTCIPRLYAAASLKCGRGRPGVGALAQYSAALCRGLIEANCIGLTRWLAAPRYSAALCRGLIEAHETVSSVDSGNWRIPRLYAAASLKRIADLPPLQSADNCIPRLYAAASLKPRNAVGGHVLAAVYSAALCRGLIEAILQQRKMIASQSCIPRLYAAASLKRARIRAVRASAILYSAALCRGLIEAARPG